MRTTRIARPASRILVAMALVTGATAANTSPASAVPAWSVVPSGSPPGAPTGSLFDVVCPTASSCFAVGGYTTGSGARPLAEHWNGTRWSAMPFPTGSGFLRSIACASTTSCLALGPGTKTARWDGTTWTSVAIADPGVPVVLVSVACPTETSCFLVGSKLGARGAQATLIERWDGAKWSIVPSPNSGGTTDVLQDVSCSSPTSCVAVGYISGEPAETLIVQWDGDAWSIVETPGPSDLPDGGSEMVLTSVSCPDETTCIAAGWYFSSGGTQRTLFEAWDSTSWSVVDSPNVSGAFANYSLGVTCASATSCFAVGAIQSTPSGVWQTLIERWDGTSWSISPSPNPDPTFNQLRSVACPASSHCFAVGDRGPGLAVVEHWDGSSWSATSDPPVNPTPANATLADVSCASAATCFAVGRYTTRSGITATLVERPAGNRWSVRASPNPSGAAYNVLTGVACPSTTMCFAVGTSSADDFSVQRTLIQRWNGTRWSIVPSPNVAQGKVSVHNRLSSVSCPSAASCFAVGDSYYKHYRTLVLHWDGKTWSIVTSPDATTTDDNFLAGVSCATASSCMAVGHTVPKDNHPSHRRTFTERWNGKKWSVVPSPNGPSGSGELASVSCLTATRCVAVGSSSASARHSLIETWNGAAWKYVASADPPSASDNALEGVSCASATACVAVGRTASSSRPKRLLVKALTGTRWSIVTAASPAGAHSADLHAVSCVNAKNCTAVGEFERSGAPLTLVERYS